MKHWWILVVLLLLAGCGSTHEKVAQGTNVSIQPLYVLEPPADIEVLMRQGISEIDMFSIDPTMQDNLVNARTAISSMTKYLSNLADSNNALPFYKFMTGIDYIQENWKVIRANLDLLSNEGYLDENTSALWYFIRKDVEAAFLKINASIKATEADIAEEVTGIYIAYAKELANVIKPLVML